MTGPIAQSRTAEPLLAVRGVDAGYAGRRILHGVDLTVPAGTIAGVVGESGSGKTTLARVVAGRIGPTSGTVALGGEPLPARRTTAQRRAVQTIHQDPFTSLTPHMTVGQAIGELLAVHRLVPREDRAARVTALLRTVDLPEDAASRRPAVFSGGQRQRIAIARALAVEPRVLVADEPTSALDMAVQEVVLRLFARLRDELGLGIVLISHDLALVARLCDHVTVLDAGAVVEQGSAQQVLREARHPVTRALLAAVPRLPRVPGPADPAPGHEPESTTKESR